jgi:hypothetical protein
MTVPVTGAKTGAPASAPMSAALSGGPVRLRAPHAEHLAASTAGSVASGSRSANHPAGAALVVCERGSASGRSDSIGRALGPAAWWNAISVRSCSATARWRSRVRTWRRCGVAGPSGSSASPRAGRIESLVEGRGGECRRSPGARVRHPTTNAVTASATRTARRWRRARSRAAFWRARREAHTASRVLRRRGRRRPQAHRGTAAGCSSVVRHGSTRATSPSMHDRRAVGP